MIEIVPKDTRYIPLTQQKWCCVPTCIQIVMLKHKIPPSGYGTQAGNVKYAPNAVFKRLKIPLKMNWKLINKFNTLEEFEKYMQSIDMLNKDVLVCYDWGTLFNNPKYHNGHVCVLDKVINVNEVRLIDPDQNAAKWVKVQTKDLFKAMQFHGKEKSAGFWELTYKKLQ